LNGTVTFATGTWQHYVDLVGVKEENEILREIIEELRRDRIQLLEAQQENERLRSLLAFRERMEQPLLPARVIAWDASGWFQTLVLDRGKNDGVSEGLAVVAVAGVVGQIMECSAHFSRVLLITDPNSSVAAIEQNSRSPGIVEGAGRDKCILKYLPPSEKVQEGDVLVASGLDRIYPKGIPIGTISRIGREETRIFQDIEVTPFVDFRKLEEVMILLAPAVEGPEEPSAP
jgi:rod shape-determining protein MreC